MNDKPEQSPAPFKFDDALKRSLYSRFCVLLMTLVDAANVSRADIRVSEPEFAAALAEVEVDIQAMLTRRKAYVSGLSHGKIAGMLAFRLARFKLVHVLTDQADLKWNPIIQEITALLLVYERVIKRTPIIGQVRELAYQLARRHANQETLALCFDAFVHYAPAGGDVGAANG